MIKSFVFLIVQVIFVSIGYAQSLVEPEKCILNTIGKGNHNNSIEISTIRFNCIRVYMKAVEINSVLVKSNLLSQVTLQWFPKIQTVGPPYYLNESVRINVKNNSLYKIISIVIVITNKENQKSETYKFYADSVIEPFTVGYFTGSVITDENLTSMEDFSSKYIWGIVSVNGVSK